jgi:glycosyltransferase involved in cell wall biosynthesis
MNNSLVSIIIPTYNRAHLIGETLESILEQTYENWECIIVDDGSTDNTDEIVQPFIKKDERFQYYKRPVDRKKGANACRNYGFEICKGEYINWFDSDDLMLPEKIAIQVDEILNKNVNFSVAKFKNFERLNQNEFKDMHQKNNYNEMNLTNFIRNNFFFGTVDFFCKREKILDIKFNESLKSGQEFNFFCNFLAKKYEGTYIDLVLTLRRIHGDSIQAIQSNNVDLINKNKFATYFTTYVDVKKDIDNETKRFLISKIFIYYIQIFKIKEYSKYRKILLDEVYENYSFFNYLQLNFILVYLLFFNFGRLKIKKLVKRILK